MKMETTLNPLCFENISWITEIGFILFDSAR